MKFGKILRQSDKGTKENMAAIVLGEQLTDWKQSKQKIGVKNKNRRKDYGVHVVCLTDICLDSLICNSHGVSALHG